MNKQDKLFERIKQAAENQEQQAFERKEAVWDKVSQKLNPKKRKRMIFYRTLSAAAVLAVIIFAGFQFTGNPDPINENPIINKDINIHDKPDSEIVEDIKDELKEAEKLEVKYLDSVENTAEDKPFIKSEKKPVVVATETDEQVDIERAKSTAENFIVDNQDSSSIENERGKQVAVLETVENKPKSSKVESVSILEEKAIRFQEAKQRNLKNKEQQITSISKTEQNTVSENSIEGTVVDSDGLPIPGVNIIIKGTSKGTQTDFDGHFSIEVEIGETLMFSYVGFKPQEVEVKNLKDLFITLEPSMDALDEVVVSSYSTRRAQRKEERRQKKLNSAAIMVNDAESNANNRQGTLSGQVAGIQINSANGEPGYASKIRIRGVGSVSGYNQNPIFIIDGKKVSEKKMKNLNPKTINSVKILKNKKATDLYGSKGSNGVVIILTKNATREQKKEFDSIIPTPAFPQKPNNEDYESFKENPFTSPLSKPLSTFSIDVDRAAYTNIRRFINNGQNVPKDAVRIEEMLNFFEYDYKKPKGKHPFAIHTAYSDAPWNDNHKLLRIALQGQDIPVEELPASNLVFLIDVSGSMGNQNKLPLVKKSLNLLTDQMRPKDKIALVTYAGNSQVVLEPTSGDQKTKIKNAINRLSTGGGTYASQGIETAYALAEENFAKGGNNRVIIATDGDFNIGVTQNESLEDLIAKKRKTNIFLTCLGYGMGNYKDSKMQSLSQKGNGNYAYIDTYQEAQKFLEREFKGSLYAIAKDVKIQIEFNPKHVDSYRLIGYETRLLQDRDFADDTKDAGEIGVNHQVTALYEIIPRGVESQFGEFNPSLKYQKVEQPDFNLYSNELATVKFRYKSPTADKSIKLERIIKNESVKLNKTSADFKFATAVAWFGLKLRDSQLISNADKAEIIELAKQGLENDKEGYRSEFIRLVRLYE